MSVGISGSYTDENGETYSPYLSELSLVASPHLKSLTPIQSTLSLQLSEAVQADLNNLSEAEEMELAEQLTDLLTRVRALEEALATPAPQEGETSEDDTSSEPQEAPVDVEASEDTGEPVEDAPEADLKLPEDFLARLRQAQDQAITELLEATPEADKEALKRALKDQGVTLSEATEDDTSEEAPEPVEETPEAPSLLTLSEADLRELIASAVQDALPARPAPPVRLAKGSDKPSPPQRLELSEWIEKTASERGISKSEAARLSMTEFNG